MSLSTLFRKSDTRKHADALYSAAVAQARQPEFYADFGVPDTVDGRFDMVALHVYLILRCLKTGEEPAPQVAQALFDAMFSDMDRNLREAGVGDLGVGPRVKDMARAFYGRIAAYELGLDDADGDTVLNGALSRNLYRDGAPDADRLSGMSAYVRSQAQALEAQGTVALAAGHARFGSVPVANQGGNQP